MPGRALLNPPAPPRRHRCARLAAGAVRRLSKVVVGQAENKPHWPYTCPRRLHLVDACGCLTTHNGGSCSGCRGARARALHNSPGRRVFGPERSDYAALDPAARIETTPAYWSKREDAPRRPRCLYRAKGCGRGVTDRRSDAAAIVTELPISERTTSPRTTPFEVCGICPGCQALWQEYRFEPDELLAQTRNLLRRGWTLARRMNAAQRAYIAAHPPAWYSAGVRKAESMRRSSRGVLSKCS